MASPFQDIEDAARAYDRVKADIDALPADDLSQLNVDLVSATTIGFAFIDKILVHREEIVKLSNFDARNVERLMDYNRAVWFLYLTHLPAAQASDIDDAIVEVTALRAKLLLWAGPLASTGRFDPTAIARIREGSGHKDAAADLISLVGLYRSKWEEVRVLCGDVTEQELDRGAQLGAGLFAALSRRDFDNTPLSDGSLRIRRAWTLLDRAYTQCRRALAYLRHDEGDLDLIAPSLRRLGPRSTTTPAEPTPVTVATPEPFVQPIPRTNGAGGAPVTGLGGSGGPFTSNP